MLLVAPNGAEVDAADFAVDELLVNGFKKASNKSRPTKAEVLAEAEAEMTNPELAEAIDKAKKSPEKPKVRKKA